MSGINIKSQRFNCDKSQSKSGITKTIKALLRHYLRRCNSASLVKTGKDTLLTKRSAPEDSRIAANAGMRALQSAISKRLVKKLSTQASLCIATGFCALFNLYHMTKTWWLGIGPQRPQKNSEYNISLNTRYPSGNRRLLVKTPHSIFYCPRIAIRPQIKRQTGAALSAPSLRAASRLLVGL